MSSRWKEGPETFAEWKAAAQLHAEQLGLPPDLWDPSDDYDLAEIAKEAFEKEVDPMAFVEDVFSEDLARMEGDAADFAESMRHALEGDDEGEGEEG